MTPLPTKCSLNSEYLHYMPQQTIARQWYREFKHTFTDHCMPIGTNNLSSKESFTVLFVPFTLLYIPDQDHSLKHLYKQINEPISAWRISFSPAFLGQFFIGMLYAFHQHGEATGQVKHLLASFCSKMLSLGERERWLCI